ncbi:hypothetical protein F5B22DRAFT_645504 [Xylaria bambusicola]|uniref:uncharacterized protein n=1 Tax=Xylaria bambusicola TaxID=326684 RepID=UPI002007E0D2|nr:uncharacterized protein F5B22DRAFT_645504 [Xylaria bambusicola]KAI0517801.1 hypothetical protein F5B22DRAFT_645504 [Xylaria bambusicola]
MYITIKPIHRLRTICLSELTPLEQEWTLNSPALPPPPGVVPNFLRPPNKNHVAIIVNVVCLVVTVLVICLRAYARICCIKKLHFEDYLIPAALATFVSSVLCQIWMIDERGAFIHEWDVRVRDLAKIYYIYHVGANLIAVTLMVLKGAILLEWMRIFVPPGTRNYFFWISTILLGVQTAFYVAWIIAENLSCIPHRRIWDITICESKCVDIKLLFIPVAGLNLVADIIILFLPQKAIWALQMSLSKKIGVALVFAIGLFACLSAAARLHVTIVFYQSEDVLYTEGAMYLFCLAEMTCLFLVFCVPSIPRVFVERGVKARFKKILSWFIGRAATTQDSGDSSPSLSHPVYANRPRSDSFRSSPRRDTIHSVNEVWGTVTEITALKHDDNHCEGLRGILCTTTISTEVTIISDAARDYNRSDTEGAEYETYQRTLLH